MSDPRAPATIDRMLATARAVIEPRVPVTDLRNVIASGDLVVDIRTLEQRRRDGDIPGALPIDPNVLEWRLDPTSPHRLPQADAGKRIVVICNEGYQSSLAAASLRSFGLHATDLLGGFQAWRTNGVRKTA